MEIIDRDVNKFDGGIIERNNKLRLYCIIFSLPATNTCLRSALMTVNEKLEESGFHSVSELVNHHKLVT